MKKLLLLGLLAVAVIAGFLYGPGLLGYYRLSQFITESNAAYQADGGPWPHLSDTCTFCHGVKGSAVNQLYPSLAAQPAAYVSAQLRGFASGQRANPNMSPLAQSLSVDDIESLSEYFARQQASVNTYFKPDPALRDKGGQLASARGCGACHGPVMMGHDQFPRLAGQGYDYLLSQFEAYAVGTRTDATGAMKAISEGLTADDRKAIATYLASLAPHGK